MDGAGAGVGGGSDPGSCYFQLCGQKDKKETHGCKTTRYLHVYLRSFRICFICGASTDADIKHRDD